MQREAFEQLLNDILDQRQPLEDGPEFADGVHLTDEQRADLAAGRCMLDGLAAGEIPTLGDDFAESVVAHVKAEAPSPATNSQRGAGVSAWGLLAACAALALLALVPFWLAKNPSNRVAEGEDEANPTVSIEDPDGESESDSKPANALAVDDTKNPVKNDGDESILPDVAQTRRHRIEQRYNDVYELILDLPQRLPQREVAEQDMMAALDEVADGLMPIANSVGGAINTLRRNLPPGDKGERPNKPQTRILRGNFARLA